MGRQNQQFFLNHCFQEVSCPDMDYLVTPLIWYANIKRSTRPLEPRTLFDNASPDIHTSMGQNDPLIQDASSQAVHRGPSMQKLTASVTAGSQFCLLGQGPKPFEKPLSGWLRVRKQNDKIKMLYYIFIAL